MRVEVSAATRHTVEDLRVVSVRRWGGRGEEAVRFSLGARQRRLFAFARTPRTPSVFDAEGMRSGRTRAGKGRRAGHFAAADDGNLRTTRHLFANASRCSSVASRDAPRGVRRITRLAIGRQSRVSERWRASERSPETRREDAVRTWTWKTAPCGRTCGFGRSGGEGCGQLRVDKRQLRGVARPMRGCRHRPTKRAMADVKREAGVPDRSPRVARDAPRSADALGGHGNLAGHEGGGHGHGGHVVGGYGKVAARSALECIAHPRSRLFIDKKSSISLAKISNGTASY